MVAGRERPPSRAGTGASTEKPAGAPNRGSVTGGRERYGDGNSDKNDKQPGGKPSGK
ncbi:MAG TPA: hypothetical protein VK504_15055 [Vicinamibacterales bacterium]|nr:hypothetical protein [Vicinamibacterales bacterium]